MIVTVIRHGKVNHTWKKWCTSSGFDEQCRLYDSAPIEKMARNKERHVSKVYISTLDRSLQTAKMLLGDMEFCSTNQIIEVPLRSAFDTGLKLPLWLWNVAGRLQWYFNSNRQLETRRQTIQRADSFVQDLLKADEDCTLVTHGFFMHTLISVLGQYGFRADKTSLQYKNGEAIVLVK